MKLFMASLLIVEDNDEDYKTLLRTFRRLSFTKSVQRCVNAKECFDYLYGEGQHSDKKENKLPVLLDLNLPGLNGHAVLKRIKEEAALKCLPVVILTTSTNSNDIESCYRAGANSYLIKPMDYRAFAKTVQHFINYWFHAVKLSFSGDVI
ncbi:MAG: response regulator [Chthonomonadaceae bacterium]|nr:response regulator [Chthonomonadaceae bacterium]